MMSRQDRPVMFRAGAAAAEEPLPPHVPAAATPRAAGPKVLLADISEFQPEVADELYCAWSGAIIIRAAYGARHDDRAWHGGQRRDQLHSRGIRFLGIYQYIAAAQDPAAQAREFCRLIGRPRQGEYYIADIEEGTGSLRHAWDTWTAVVTGTLGPVPCGNYSGRLFARDHSLEPVDWIASYGTAEPAEPHLLWQFTGNFQVPGVGRADCSVFHGTIGQLAALGYGGHQQNWTETLMDTLPTLQLGNRDHPGSVQFVHRLQALVTVIGDINRLPGASAVKADGIFGPATTAGLLRVRKFFGLAEDGICGPKTWAALVAGQRS